MPRFLDLFAGAGGLSEALSRQDTRQLPMWRWMLRRAIH